MRIDSMTATFGKLEHQTLTLQPGLNIIEAPNEWGKSTWCAFLIAMLYGIETRVKTTKTTLADKERYAPWSGSPMSGRIDLHWNGRAITIERSSKSRQPMGVFRAYETETGLDVPELTADNCGQVLLGVERNVFTKAGFLRFTDLPVAQDEALRKRLNALVTTGDESGEADLLAQKLRDLKNKCRYNRSGLLPAAEKQRDDLKQKLDDHLALTSQTQRLRQRQTELESWAAQLENHKAALRYNAAQDDARRLQEAAAAREDALAQNRAAEQECRGLPSRDEARQALTKLDDLRREQDSLAMEEQMMPPLPQLPEVPELFRGIQPDDAVAQAEADRSAFTALQAPKKPSAFLPLLGGLGILAGIVLLVLKLWPIAIAAFALGAAGLIFGLIRNRNYRRVLEDVNSQQQKLHRRYGSDDPDRWVAMAAAYRDSLAAYRREMERCRQARGDLDQRREALARQLGAQDLGSRSHWEEIIAAWDRWANTRRDLMQAEKHLQALEAMAKTAEPPSQEDHLTYSEAETNRLLSDAGAELRLLHQRLGQFQGQSDALGNVEILKRELERVEARINKLEQTYAALELAQKVLADASAELQRRFAPRISRQAQELFEELTDGRYQALTLASDLSLHAAAQGEDTLHSHQWRSDGTVDQLYLALRLAVARELTPDAPLILDDALVRFDDTRLAAALKILRREAENKQVILFTCQGRENTL